MNDIIQKIRSKMDELREKRRETADIERQQRQELADLARQEVRAKAEQSREERRSMSDLERENRRKEIDQSLSESEKYLVPGSPEAIAKAKSEIEDQPQYPEENISYKILHPIKARAYKNKLDSIDRKIAERDEDLKKHPPDSFIEKSIKTVGKTVNDHPYIAAGTAAAIGGITIAKYLRKKKKEKDREMRDW